MRKILMTLLAGIALVFGMAAAPASDAGAAGFIRLFEGAGGTGDSVDVPESEIPASCDAIPDELSVVNSADNRTFDSGTTVEFFGTADDECTTVIETVGPGEAKDIAGAGYWMATSSP